MSVRVRFAPSPTGFLHIGGARTALFNWLFARHNGGSFILRIEDTDRTRSTDDYIEAIISGMKWLGLDWDEGPFRQTDRFHIYKSSIDRLLAEGKAYYCYCSPEELEERRQAAIQKGETAKYDGRCRERKEPVSGVTPVVRFVMPQMGGTIVEDLVRGNVNYDNSMFDDFIILRSDGSPTYNFVVVVDDVDMAITHVIRGDDHLNNTPKQIHIYKALGYTVPKFAHLPMILGPDKTRLSKRHGATSVEAYRDLGYLPQALLNYLVRLGWSFGDQEVFSKEELIEKFTPDSIGKAAAVFNPEKLIWMNQQYIINTPAEKLAHEVMPFLVREKVIENGHSLDIGWLSRAVETLRERARTLVELAQSLRYYIAEDIVFDDKSREKFLKEEALPYLKDLLGALEGLKSFGHDELEAVFKSIIEKYGIKLKNLAQPVRVAMTGGTMSPGIYDLIEIIGKEKTLRRLERAIKVIEGKE